MIKKFTKNFAAILIVAITIFSCNTNSTTGGEEPPIPPIDTTTPPPPPVDPDKVDTSELRTVLIYIHADHDQYASMYGYLRQIEKGWTDEPEKVGQLLVYFYPNEAGEEIGNLPRMYRIKKNDNIIMKSELVKQYDERHDALDPIVMRGVIEDAMKIAPARSYGLCFASHGYGWVPEDRHENTIPKSNNYSQDSRLYPFANKSTLGFGRKMEGWDMVHKAMPEGVVFDFIAYNACLMASVELLYEFKDKCKYIISSPAEMPTGGFRYATSVQKLFGDIESLKSFASDFFNFFDDQFYRSATISVVDCSKLDALATATKNVVSQPYESIPGAEIQFFNTASGQKIFFDLEDYIVKTWGSTSDKALMDNFSKALNDAIIFNAHTPEIGNYPVHNSCGMSSYVPYDQHSYYSKIYKTKYKWGEASGLNKVVEKEESVIVD